MKSIGGTDIEKRIAVRKKPCYNKIGKEMDFGEIFLQTATRQNKMDITEEAIGKIRNVKLEAFAEDECERICELHRKLLRTAKEKNKSNEVGVLVNLLDWEEITVLGEESGISLRNDIRARELLFTAPKNSLLFLHNHPKNRVFSERDLASFLTADSILMMSVICNNGVQYFLIKIQQFCKDDALAYYEEIFEAHKNGSMKEFLRTCRKVGLSFTFGGV